MTTTVNKTKFVIFEFDVYLQHFNKGTTVISVYFALIMKAQPGSLI